MHYETELKLLFRPEDLTRLGGLSIVGERTKGRPRKRPVLSIYYDTPRRELRRQGVILRVRKVDGRYIQGVKSEGRRIGGGTVRPEWECPVPTEAPLLSAIGDDRLKRLRGVDRGQARGDASRDGVGVDVSHDRDRQVLAANQARVVGAQ